MTGVIYARYSSDSQREESIEGQLRECMAFAEKIGFTIVSTVSCAHQIRLCHVMRCILYGGRNVEEIIRDDI